MARRLATGNDNVCLEGGVCGADGNCTYPDCTENELLGAPCQCGTSTCDSVQVCTDLAMNTCGTPTCVDGESQTYTCTCGSSECYDGAVCNETDSTCTYPTCTVGSQSSVDWCLCLNYSWCESGD